MTKHVGIKERRKGHAFCKGRNYSVAHNYKKVDTDPY